MSVVEVVVGREELAIDEDRVVVDEEDVLADSIIEDVVVVDVAELPVCANAGLWPNWGKPAPARVSTTRHTRRKSRELFTLNARCPKPEARSPNHFEIALSMQQF
jgi:hypothetical protein